MDAPTFILSSLAVLVLCVTASLGTCVMYARHIRASFRSFFKSEVDEADGVMRALRSERGRALAMKRWSDPRQRAASRAVDAGGEGDAEDEEDDEDAVNLPPALLGLAQGAGLDMEAIKRGDMNEIRRGLALLQQAPGATNGAVRARPKYRLGG